MHIMIDCHITLEFIVDIKSVYCNGGDWAIAASDSSICIYITEGNNDEKNAKVSFEAYVLKHPGLIR